MEIRTEEIEQKILELAENKIGKDKVELSIVRGCIGGGIIVVISLIYEYLRSVA